ncbi:exodeoxyribonuclease V subunit gamma [Nakamurella endophytica]|uniref:RecBCD enzyme subunit RecC n=1 Tax=Nakamurella endophytica TaxID=1748367 RepID=A0A917WF33_9ACTN|nr:exodeoxyribonuclease V subunit gamma [Nakamurella endophytica]GGL99784.1 RecBCD enzyme subunit RecC [Nakamurella endophytica]
MTLHLHRAERADRLVGGLADLLTAPGADPFAAEVVAVPARGVERWLTQQLSHRLGAADGRADGVCAGVRFPSPRELVSEVLSVADHDPWSPDSLTWPVLQVLDEAAGEAWCAMVSRHLGYLDESPLAAHRRGRRYAVARRLAGLFHTYAQDRPGMLAEWLAGRDTDGLGDPLPADLRWEAELWRRVRGVLPGPDPVQRVVAAATLLRTDPAATDLPARLSVFGPTRLPRTHLRLLDALAVHRDVHLWLPHPSPALWQRVAAAGFPVGGPGTVGTGRAALPRRDDPTVTVPRHPLLASLARDARELQVVLAQEGTGGAGLQDHHHAEAGRPAGTLLELLQARLRDDDVPADLTTVAPDDRSVQVHACHGPHRQVEVLRDALVGMLDRDPSLEPRDVLVMCPDIEAYAPLVAAAFGLADVVGDGTDGRGHPGHRLRVRLADRALHQTNPLLATVDKLLTLADGRVTASQVLDLAAWGPVRLRFRFDDDDLDRLGRWVMDAGVRWGLDAPHRRRFKLDAFGQNTWRAGLDRILLGVAMADEDHNTLGVALPLDDVGSGDVDLAGRLAELLDRLRSSLETLTGPRSLQQWLDALERALGLLTRVTGTDSWQLTEVRREFADVADQAGDRAATALLGLPDVRALLQGRLAGRPTRANFRSGTLTVCTMVPMRSVPHRVVCLLGLDDGVFPRNVRTDGDDVLARRPAVGERDARGEDRQLLLDAVLAATEHLVVTYAGADERTGVERPPAVPIGELLDALDRTARPVDPSRRVRDQVLVRHPLQPFDPRNLHPRVLGTDGPFSYDPSALAGARAAAGPRRPPPVFLPAELPPRPAADVELADLVALLTHPVKGFLRQRLDLAIRYDEDEPDDRMSVALDSLEQWQIGDRLLRDRLAGADADACRQAEWRRGTLPPGPLGDRTLGDLLRNVEPLVERTAPLRVDPARAVDVAVPLPDGRQLRGTVSGVHGTRLLTVTYSKLGSRPQLTAWIGLLALAAAHPGVDWTAVVVARGSSTTPQTATFGPLEQPAALRTLAELVDLYDRGLCAPLPLPLKTGEAYANGRLWNPDAEDAVRAAQDKWTTRKFPGEDADHSHVRVWGRRTLTDLMAARPADDERWTGEQSRFGELARRLWTPLLEHRVRGAL